jgi:RHS repeat-associated protein
MFADVNGDGLADAIGYSDRGGALFLQINLGSGFTSWGSRLALDSTAKNQAASSVTFKQLSWFGSTIAIPGEQYVSHAMIPGDFNGDGLTDLLMLDNGCRNGNASRSKPVLYTSNGNKLVPSDLGFDIGDGDKGGNMACPTYRTSMALDVNGDGVADVTQLKGGKLQLFVNRAQPRLLRTILESLWVTKSFHYQPYRWSASEVKGPSSAPSYPQLGQTRGLWVADQVQEAMTSTGMKRTVTHRFEDGRTDLKARQFLGFARHIKKDVERVATTTYSLKNHDVWTTPSERDSTVSKRLYPWHGVVVDTETETILTARQNGGWFGTAVQTGEASVYGALGASTIPGVCPAPVPAGVVTAETVEYGWRTVGGTTTRDITMPELSPYYLQSPPFTFSNGYPFKSLTVTSLGYDQYNNVSSQATAKSWKLTDSQGSPFDSEAPDLTPGPTAAATATPLEVDNATMTYNYDESKWLLKMPSSRTVSSTGVDGKSGSRQITYTVDTHGAVVDTYDSPMDLGHTLWQHNAWNQYGLLDSVDLTGNAVLGADGKWTSQKRTTKYTYDVVAPYAPSAITNAMGQATQTVFSSETGKLLVSVDPDNRTTRYYYDTFGRLRQIARENDLNTMSYSYPFTEDVGIPAKTVISAGAGARLEVYYDELGRTTYLKQAALKDAATAADSMVDVSWDEFGRRTFVSEPYFMASPAPAKTGVKTTYDAIDRPLSETPDAATGLGATTYVYDGISGATVTDGRGKTRSVFVDSLGRARISKENNAGATVTTRQYFTYFGLPAGVKDAAGNRVTVAYDSAGRRLSVDDPDAGKTTFTSNAFGEVVKEVDQKGNRRFEYDKLGRITKRIENDNDAAPTEFIWDKADHATGQLWKTSTPDGVRVERGYDTLGRPASMKWTIASATFEVGTVFDAAGRLSTMTYPPGWDGSPPEVTYQYSQVQDRGAQLVKVLRGTNSLWQLNSLDASGRLTGFTYGNHAQTTQTYQSGTDLLHEYKVTTQVGGQTATMRDDIYAYDQVGNVQQIQSQLASLDGAAYTCDDLNRLASWASPTTAAPTTYQYDDVGNLKWKRGAAAGGQDIELKYEGATKNAGPHAVTNMSGAGDFGYNAKGEQTSAPDRTVEYTSFGLPSSITRTATGAATIYAYDAENTRVSRQNSDGTSALYAGGLYEQRTTSSGTSHVFYIVVGGQIIGQIESSSTGENMRYFHQDRLGSTIGTSGNGGASFWARDPWGRLLTDIGDTVRVGFTGQEDDVESGLINMGGRIYDPKTTRFLTPDPVGGGLGHTAANRYAYVLNNPTNLVDPTGFQEWSPADSIESWETSTPIGGYYYGAEYPPGQEAFQYRRTDSGYIEEWEPIQVYKSLGRGTSPDFTETPSAVSSTVTDQTGNISASTAAGLTTARLYGSSGIGHLNDTSHRHEIWNGFYSGVNPTTGAANTLAEGAWSLVGPTSPKSFAAMTIGGPLIGRGLGSLAGKLVGRITTRALTKADLGLVNAAIARLEGAVMEAGSTRILQVGYVEAASRGSLGLEVLTAIPEMLKAAEAAGIRTLRIEATFANPKLADVVTGLVVRNGGTMETIGGLDIMTFILGAK